MLVIADEGRSMLSDQDVCSMIAPSRRYGRRIDAGRRQLDRMSVLCNTVRMRIGDVGKLADALDGVRHTTPGGLSRWEYHGCLVARQLDGEHIVIRANFAYRDAMLRAFPATFEVPQRFRKHMMMVADLTSGDPEAINDSLTAAWELQRNAD